jgi:hypothetical protein
MADAEDVALVVSSEDPYASIQALFNRCKDDIQNSIASSIKDIKEYLTSPSPNNQGKTTLPSPDKADAARRSMKQIAKNVCLTPKEQTEFDRLIKSIENDLFAKYANALNKSWGGRRKSRKSRRSKSKKRSRR